MQYTRAPRSIRFSLLICALLFMGAKAEGQSFKQRVIDAHRHDASSAAIAAERIGTAFARWEESNAVLLRRPELRVARGLNVDQILAYDRLAAAIPEFEVRWDDEGGGVPIYLSGSPLQRSRSTLTGGGIHDATVRAFFSACGGLLDIPDPGETFVPVMTRREENGYTHLKFSQLRSGVPIHGREVVCRLLPNGDLDLFMGRYTPASRRTTGSFALSAADAVGAAVAHVAAGTSGVSHDAAPSLLMNDGQPVVSRCWFDDGEELHAAYHVQLHPALLQRWELLVAAEDGRILRAFNAVCADGPEKAAVRDLLGRNITIDTYLHQGTYFMIDATRPMFDAANSIFPNGTYGTIITLNANNSDLASVTHATSADNTWSDRSAITAHNHASVVYNYFRATHGRNSIDDKGGTIISVVNVTQDGLSMENAFWNGKLMAYGNGSADFDPFAKALDIAAHEMTHGVTEHTAGLEYLNQSGALNEAFSDIFGAMVDRDDWLIGEDITKNLVLFPTGAVRSMEDPHNGVAQGDMAWQPNHMNEYQQLPETADNGGVHVNSGIINRSAYLLAAQIGREAAEKILYNALTTKLTRQARFIDYRLAILEAAEELYSATEAQACATACDQVGILDGKPTDKPVDYPPVGGIDRMLYTNTDPFLPAPLWIVVPPAGPQDFTSVSFTNVWSRPSISDDGSVAVFVSDEFNIHAISLVGEPNEQIIDNSEIWNSIAISKDKSLLAVTTILLNPEVYVIDISGSTPVANTFEISTPNYTGDDVPNSARFVDAMEFSLDGESLLFDTFNELEIGGYSYGFWDINIMNVWDKAADNYADGRIERLFPQEPAMNLGNPTFAKTKRSVIAFDAQFPTLGTSYVMAMDLLASEPKIVTAVPEGTFGYPNYSATDAALAFVVTDQGIDVIYNVSMASDGVTPAGSPQGFVAAGTWPLWFRSGTRPLSAEVVHIPEAAHLDQNFPNPFNPSTTVPYTLREAGTVVLTVHDALGREVATLAAGRRDPGAHVAQWDGRDEAGVPQPSGVYLARLSVNGSTFTRHMLLLK